MIVPVEHSAQMLALWTPGWPEIVIILVAILLLFGGKKLPEMARGLARGLRIFRDEMKGIKTDIDTDTTKKEDQDTPSQDGDAGKDA